MRTNAELEGPIVGAVTGAETAVVVAYVGLLVGAAAVLQHSISAGLACYAGLLFVILTHLGFAEKRPDLQPCLVGLALVCVLKLGAFVLPQQLLSRSYWEALPCLLALAIVVVLRAQNLQPPARGVPRSRRLKSGATQLAIAATGPPLALVYTSVEPNAPALAFTGTPVAVLAVAALSGFTLEFVFRSWVQASLVELVGSPGILLTGLLYGSLFVGSAPDFALLVGVATSLFWGALAAATQTARGVILAHALFALSWAMLH